ncbi:MAG: SDR family NAD(P)-dependent oxidoreductase [Chloroflexota bacterium]
MEKTVILITGAANGIGLHFVESNRDQFRFVATDLSMDQLRDRYGPDTADLLLLPLNVTQEAEWQDVLNHAQRKFGRIDIIINNAGVIMPAFITDATAAQMHAQIDVNTKGVMLGTMLGAKLMEKQGYGHIINLASLGGVAPVTGISFYSASKFAVRGFSLAAGLELRAQNIDVTVICPDLVKTAMFDIQLDMPNVTPITFSGPQKTLTVEDLNKVLLRAIRQKPPEITYPLSRGILAKIASAFPWLTGRLQPIMARKGAKNIQELRRAQ